MTNDILVPLCPPALAGLGALKYKVTCSELIGLFESPTPWFRRYLELIYGANEELIAGQSRLVLDALRLFREKFGDAESVGLVRCPARINLRGMHLDAFGGTLNFMTHQREMLVVLAAREDAVINIVNTDAKFGNREIAFSSVNDKTSDRSDWQRYLRGAVHAMMTLYPDKALRGFNAVLSSNIPTGASLSSSHALVVTSLLALGAANDLTPARTAILTAAREAEWYAGARSGLGDQGAMLYGRAGSLLHTTFFESDLADVHPVYAKLPEDISVLVVNSFLTRAISGADALEFNRNRFSYEIALSVFRRVMERQQLSPQLLQQIDRIGRVTEDAFLDYGGTAEFYRLLLEVPISTSLDQLKRDYPDIGFSETYNRYFGLVAEALRPVTFDLRAALLYGIAETARAERFYTAIRSGDIVEAGRLMSCGHDGDRKVIAKPNGETVPFVAPIDDAYLKQLLAMLESGDAEAREQARLEWQCGGFRASSPDLDHIVDIAVQTGALGASLTGGGIAGCVVMLVRRGDEQRVRDALIEQYFRPNQARLGLSDKQIEHDAVVKNIPIACAGMLDPRMFAVIERELQLEEEIPQLRQELIAATEEERWAFVQELALRLENLGYERAQMRLFQRDPFRIDHDFNGMKETFLVTGGAGLIGANLVKRLLRAGHRVIVVDDFNDYYDPADKYENIAPFIENPCFILYETDIRDREALESIFEHHTITKVVHLAARAGVRASISNPTLYATVNVLGTQNVLDLAHQFDVKHVVYASSSSVYGGLKTFPFREDMAISPISPYAATKRMNELQAACCQALYGMQLTGVRFFTVYGPGPELQCPGGRPDMAIRKFTDLLTQGKPVPMYGDGTLERDYTYVDDIVDGIMRVIERGDRLGNRHEVINLGESDTTPLLKLVLMLAVELGRLDPGSDAELDALGLSGLIKRLLGSHGKDQLQHVSPEQREQIISLLERKGIVRREPPQAGDVPLTYADISKARELIGYDPRTKITAGVKRFTRAFSLRRRFGRDEQLRGILRSYQQLLSRAGLDDAGMQCDPNFKKEDFKKLLDNITAIESRLKSHPAAPADKESLLHHIIVGHYALIGRIAAYLECEHGGMSGLLIHDKRRNIIGLLRATRFERMTTQQQARLERLTEALLASARHAPCIAVVPAAGFGTRMKEKMPNSPHKQFLFLGDDMVVMSIRAIAPFLIPREEGGAREIVVVVGPEPEVQERMREAIERSEFTPENKYKVHYVVQEERIGDGDAVLQAAQTLDGYEGDIIVGWADRPLNTGDTMDWMCRIHRALGIVPMTIPSLVTEQPYSPIIRNRQGRVVWNWQKDDYKKDCTPEAICAHTRPGDQNVGQYIGRAHDLFAALRTTQQRFSNNPQYRAWHAMKKSNGEKPPVEYYLTDCIRLLVRAGHELVAPRLAHEHDRLSVNHVESFEAFKQQIREESPAVAVSVDVSPEKREAIIRLVRLTPENEPLMHHGEPALLNYTRLRDTTEEAAMQYAKELAARVRNELGLKVV